MGYKRILVPVDGSKTAARGMAEAVKLARDNGAKLLLLHVVEEFPALASAEAALAIDSIIGSLRSAGRRTLEGAAKAAQRAGAMPQKALVENFGGRIADVIIGKAREWKADLIVMGTHGRRGVNRALMGSDAETVVRSSTIPVLLVPARERAQLSARRK